MSEFIKLLNRNYLELANRTNQGETGILSLLTSLSELHTEEIDQLKADLEKAKECIEFYGDEDNYDWEDFRTQKEKVIVDDGKRARQFLKDLTFEEK